jgi:hypothetical protein
MNTASTVFQGVPLLFKSPITEFTAFLKFPVGQARLTKELDFFASESQLSDDACSEHEQSEGNRKQKNGTNYRTMLAASMSKANARL